MPSLLDRSKGYAAFAVRRALGRSPDARIAELETEVRELKRTLAHQLRLFNGLSVNSFGSLVNLDHRQRLHFISRDDTVTLSKVDGLPYAVDFAVDPAALPFCENAIAGIVDCEGDPADVTGCGDRIEFHAGTYVAAKLDTPDTAGNVAVVLDWCAPPTDSVPITIGGWEYGAPTGWMELSVGDACAGGCTTVLVPYWNDPNP